MKALYPMTRTVDGISTLSNLYAESTNFMSPNQIEIIAKLRLFRLRSNQCKSGKEQLLETTAGFKESQETDWNKVQICVEYLQADFVGMYILKTSKDGYDEEGYTGTFFSKQQDMNELAAKWGIGFIGYRRRPDGWIS
eukprot:scaffold168_cov124-Cylindrotheca_fusiformis.AAC.1